MHISFYTYNFSSFRRTFACYLYYLQSFLLHLYSHRGYNPSST